MSLALRIILDLLIAACIVLGWWYVALPAALIAAWVMPFYAELPVAGLFYDSLYGLGRGSGIAGFLGIIVSLVSAGIILILKRAVKR